MKAISVDETIAGDCPSDFGAATLVPGTAAGPSEAELACAVANSLIDATPRSRATVMKSLRTHFPRSPLMVRAAALGALTLRRAHMPR